MSNVDKKNELKLEHYKQRVVELTLGSEERVSELRVELTLLSEELEQAKARIQELEDGSSKKKD